MSPSPADFKLSTKDVADRLGVTQDTVTRWAKAGKLAHVLTPGGWRRFRAEDLDAFAASLVQEQQGGGEAA